MTTKSEINTLWQEFRQAINTTYANGQTHSISDRPEDDATCLRDYAENISWSDDLAALLGRESAEERRHRASRPSVAGFSIETAAKLLIMENARTGAEMPEMPRATAFLVLRQTAVEAEVIGYLVREQLTEAWKSQVKALDYSKLMKGEVA